jgi:hypothetical protein
MNNRLIRAVLAFLVLIVTQRVDGTAQTVATVYGTVTGADTGAGLGFVTVTALDGNYATVGSAFTSASGAYTLSVSPGVAYLYFDAPTVQRTSPSAFVYSANDYLDQFLGGALSFELARPITVSAGQSLTGIDTVLARSGVVTGRMTDPSGAPVAINDQAIYLQSPCWLEIVRTRNGEYIASGLPAVPHTVWLSSNATFETQYFRGQPSAALATPVSVSSAITTANIDFSLQPLRKVLVRFRAPNGDPLNVSSADLLDEQGNRVASSNVNSGSEREFYGIRSNSARFTLIALGPPGYPVQYFGGKLSLASADFFTLPSVGLKTIDMTLTASSSVTLTGSLLDAATGQALPINSGGSGARLNVSALLYRDGYAPVSSAVVGDDAQYAFPGLTPGDYTLQVYVSGGEGWVPHRSVTVTIGAQPVTRDVSIERGGYISGRVMVSGTTQGVIRPRLSVFDSAGRDISRDVPFDTYIQTNIYGQYRIGPLPAGVYQVRYKRQPLYMMPDCRVPFEFPDAVLEPTLIRAQRATQRDITVAAGMTTTAQFAVSLATPQPGSTQPTPGPQSRRLFLPLTRR